MTCKGSAMLLIPNSAVGAVIGKAGATIREIQSSSGAQIKVCSRETEGTTKSERIIILDGTIDQIEAAFSAVLVKAEEKPSEDDDDAAAAASPAASEPMKLRILMRNSMIGHIIGKNGATIKRLAAETNGDFKINDPEMYPGPQTLRIITVDGSSPILGKALQAVMERLQTLDDGSREHAGDSQAALYSGAFPVLGPTTGRGSRQEKNIVLVPENMVGVIIGRGGSNSRAIADDSGAKIHVESREEKETRIADEDPEESNGDVRHVIVMGTTEQQFKAQRRIYDLLSSEEQRREVQGPYRMKVHFPVAVAVLGSVIGKGGAKIQEISVTAGAKLNLLRWTDEKPDDDVVIEIIGVFEETQAAQNLIRQVVFDARLRNAGK